MYKIRTAAVKEYVDGDGKTQYQEVAALTGIVIWSGAGTTNVPTGPVAIGTIGFNNDGIDTANVYIFNGTTWNDTTQTVAGFFGV